MMQRLLLMLAFVLAGNLPEIAYGHEVRPGYLELRHTGAESWRCCGGSGAGEMRTQSIRSSGELRLLPNASPSGPPVRIPNHDDGVKGGLGGRVTASTAFRQR